MTSWRTLQNDQAWAWPFVHHLWAPCNILWWNVHHLNTLLTALWECNSAEVPFTYLEKESDSFRLPSCLFVPKGQTEQGTSAHFLGGIKQRKSPRTFATKENPRLRAGWIWYKLDLFWGSKHGSPELLWVWLSSLLHPFCLMLGWSNTGAWHVCINHTGQQLLLEKNKIQMLFFWLSPV